MIDKKRKKKSMGEFKRAFLCPVMLELQSRLACYVFSYIVITMAAWLSDLL